MSNEKSKHAVHDATTRFKETKDKFLRTAATVAIASATLLVPQRAKAQQQVQCSDVNSSSSIVTLCGGGKSISYINSEVPFLLTPTPVTTYPYYPYYWGYYGWWGYPSWPSIQATETANRILEEASIMDVRNKNSNPTSAPISAKSETEAVNKSVDDAIHAVLKTERLGKQIVESNISRLTLDVKLASGMVENPTNGKAFPVYSQITVTGTVEVSGYSVNVNQRYLVAGYGNEKFVVQRPDFDNQR